MADKGLKYTGMAVDDTGSYDTFRDAKNKEVRIRQQTPGVTTTGGKQYKAMPSDDSIPTPAEANKMRKQKSDADQDKKNLEASKKYLGFKKGGAVKSIDGCAQRGKTKGRVC